MRQIFIFLLLVTAGSASLLTGCSSIKEPEFRFIENTRLDRLGLEESNLRLDLVYHNPNQTRLRLKKAEGQVWIDDNFLGQFLVDTLVQIPANADFRLPVKLKVDMSRILKNSILAFFSKEVLLKIEGTARLGKAGFYIRYPIWYEGKHNVAELFK